MLEQFLKYLKARRLRIAREKHAYWKAKREALAEPPEKSEFEKMMGMSNPWHTEKVAEAAAKEAQFMERVETLLRE